MGIQAPGSVKGELRLPQKGSVCLGAGPHSCYPTVLPELSSPQAKCPGSCSGFCSSPGCGLGSRAVSGQLGQGRWVESMPGLELPEGR